MTGIEKIVLIAAGIGCLWGCDFIRVLAGRPTSKELETIKIEKEASEEAILLKHQAKLDSLKRVEQAMADSLAALETHLMDSLSQRKGTLMSPSKLGGLYSSKLEAKYYIVVGAFRNHIYAERKKAKCDAAGYPAEIVTFRNGLNAVALCPSQTLNEVLKAKKKLKNEDICPPDVWILVNE